MENNITTIIMAGGKGTRLGIPKIYYQFRNKPLWGILYDKFSKYTQSVLIVGLDIESEETRIKSLIQALKEVRTDKVLVVDITMPLISDFLIEKLIQKSAKHSSVSAMTYVDETVYDMQTKNYDSSISLCKIEPIQIFDKDVLLQCLMETTIEEAREFTEIYRQATGVNPFLIEAGFLEVYKLITKQDAFVIENIMKATQSVANLRG